MTECKDFPTNSPEPPQRPEHRLIAFKKRVIESWQQLQERQRRVEKKARELTPLLFPGHQYDELPGWLRGPIPFITPPIMGLNVTYRALKLPTIIFAMQDYLREVPGASVRMPLFGIDKSTMRHYAEAVLPIEGPEFVVPGMRVIERDSDEWRRLSREVGSMLAKNEVIGGILRYQDTKGAMATVVDKSGNPRADIWWRTGSGGLKRRKRINLSLDLTGLGQVQPQPEAIPS